MVGDHQDAISRPSHAAVESACRIADQSLSSRALKVAITHGPCPASAPNTRWALDAGTGRELWRLFSARELRDWSAMRQAGFNRGVAWAGVRVLMVTDHARDVGLGTASPELSSGKSRWPTGVRIRHNLRTAHRRQFGCIRHGGRRAGCMIAHEPLISQLERKRRASRTVPKPGEPGSETWKGKAIEHPSAVTWFRRAPTIQNWTLCTGQTGNPSLDYNDEERGATISIRVPYWRCNMQNREAQVALPVHTVETSDWDATEPPSTQWQKQNELPPSVSLATATFASSMEG